MGIGGLDTEFSSIFRRAFASRVFPPGLVEKLGIQHVKGGYDDDFTISCWTHCDCQEYCYMAHRVPEKRCWRDKLERCSMPANPKL